jgi:hypothetical protein
MNEEELKQFVQGSLPKSSVHNPDYKHEMLHFAFPAKSANRSVAQVKQFMKTKGIQSKDYSWIELLKGGKYLEVTCHAVNAKKIIEALQKDLTPKNTKISEYFDRPELWQKGPETKAELAERLTNTAQVLEKMKIRKHLCRFFEAFALKLTSICVDEMDVDTSVNADVDCNNPKRVKGPTEEQSEVGQSADANSTNVLRD